MPPRKNRYFMQLKTIPVASALVWGTGVPAVTSAAPRNGMPPVSSYPVTGPDTRGPRDPAGWWLLRKFLGFRYVTFSNNCFEIRINFPHRSHRSIRTRVEIPCTSHVSILVHGATGACPHPGDRPDTEHRTPKTEHRTPNTPHPPANAALYMLLTPNPTTSSTSSVSAV